MIKFKTYKNTEPREACQRPCEVLYVSITDITALLTLTVVLHQALGVLPRVYAHGAQLLVLDGGGRQAGRGLALHPGLGLHVVHRVGEVSVVGGASLARFALLEGGTLELHVSSLSE